MTELQWQIVQRALSHREELFGIEPQTISQLHAAGPESDVSDDVAIWLQDVGKRIGLVKWAPGERDSYRRFKSAARKGFCKHWRGSSRART